MTGEGLVADELLVSFARHFNTIWGAFFSLAVRYEWKLSILHRNDSGLSQFTEPHVGTGKQVCRFVHAGHIMRSFVFLSTMGHVYWTILLPTNTIAQE